MKKQFYAVSFLLLGICCVLVPGVYAQSITINGGTYAVLSNTTLNTQTSYYQVTDKSVAGALPQSYIKVGNTYSKTVFGETELKTFFQTGLLSSLGKMGSMRVTVGTDIITFTYIDKGTCKVLFTNNVKDTTGFYEYTGTAAGLATAIAAARASGGGGTGYTCGAICEGRFNACVRAGWRLGVCELCYIDCAEGCGGSKASIFRSEYQVPTLNLIVK